MLRLPRRFSAGEVAIGPDDWNEMIKINNSSLITGSPVNTTATFCGDTLFAKPPAVVIEETRIPTDRPGAFQRDSETHSGPVDDV